MIMEASSRKFRSSAITSALLFFGAIMFPFFAYLSVMNRQGKGTLTIFLVLFVLCLFTFVSSIYSVTITENEIIVYRYLRAQKLAWREIYEIIPKWGDSFLLSNRDGDVRVFVSSQVRGYIDLVYEIRQMCPDIWRAQDVQTFHSSPWAALFFGLMGAGLAVAGGRGLLTAGDQGDLFSSLLISAPGLWACGTAFRAPRTLSFEGAQLAIGYLWWERRIHANQVRGIRVEHRQVRNAITYFVNLELESGKKLVLNNYKEGMPALINALEKWVEKNRPLQDRTT